MKSKTRRGFLKTAGVLGTTLAVGSQFTSPTKAADGYSGTWTMPRGNPGRTGATTDPGPGSNVTTEWSFDMNGGMHTAEPVVDNGTVYLAVTTAHTPSVSKGYVAAFDLEQKTTVWKHDGISRPGTPTISGDTVFFNTGGSEDAEASGFFALDSNSGEQKWHKSASAGLSNALVADGRLYVDISGSIAQLDPSTGDSIWTTDGVDGTACYIDGIILTADGVALQANDGSVLWDVSADEDTIQTAVDNLVYGIGNKDDNEPVVKARSTSDGTVQWEYPLGFKDEWWGSRLTVAHGHVFFGVGNSIRAVDAKSGEEAWRTDISAELSSAPSVGGETLYVPGRTTPEQDDGDALIVALDPLSGEQKWDYSFGSWDFDEYGPTARSPVISDGRAFVTTYPMMSTLDWMYTEYADFHVLGSGSKTTTTTESSTQTETTTHTTTESTTGTETATKTKTTTVQETTTTGTNSEVTTTSASTTGQSTMSKTTTTSTDKTATGESTIQSTSTSTTNSDGQPGFGVLTTIGGLAGVGAYLRSRLENSE
ncbi:PQQ-binding-like beta-propeller repeat protein [Haladaptatus sp. CMAA 1911]|uniref:outer membrane protein assembly factor BamB family protein n=1 Tax=unclassified Haladaptatus TaxID=2622732 RepID=UPI003754B2AE